MTPTYAVQIGLAISSTNVGASKINGSLLKTHGMISAKILVQDKEDQDRFFEETFLLVNTSMGVVLSMILLFFSETNIDFDIKDLFWRSYIIAKALSTTNRVELIDKREFAKMVLDKNLETFVMHISALEAMTIHPSQATQIAALH